HPPSSTLFPYTTLFRSLTYQMDFPVPVGQLAQIAVLAIFGIIAAAEIGISTQILLVLIAVLLAATAGTFTLAFGLGSRDVARSRSEEHTSELQSLAYLV